MRLLPVCGENCARDCVSVKAGDKKIPEAGCTSGKSILEATTGFEPVIEVLQTSALPLGHVAGYCEKNPRTVGYSVWFSL